MRSITKTFPGVTANDSVNLVLYPGEVLALLGENGAGKSSLMNILCGLYRPDSGEIIVKGKTAHIHSPKDSSALGIGMVHQNFMLVDTMTVAENVILGSRNLTFIPDMENIKENIRRLSDLYNLSVDPDAYVWQLSVGEQQRVEIMKLLYRNADILILDEPTAVLTPGEAADLNRVIKTMKNEGKGAIFITHKMEEVMEFSDRVMVLRQGKVTAEKPTGATDPRDLAKLMVGREVLFRYEKGEAEPGAEILKMDNICASDDRGLPALKDVSLTIHSGEILGIAGVAGNGQRELAEVVTGLRKADSGSIHIGCAECRDETPLSIIRKGVSHIPQDRIAVGVVGDMSVAQNLIMKGYRKKTIIRNGILRPSVIIEWAKKLISSYKIATPSPNTRTKFLSGGNIQKTILAREIESCGCLLVAVYPSRGLDLGATEAVRKELIAQRDKGTAVLLVSEDLEELLSVADKIAVLFEGRIAGLFPSDQATAEQIGYLMAGVAHDTSL